MADRRGLLREDAAGNAADPGARRAAARDGRDERGPVERIKGKKSYGGLMK